VRISVTPEQSGAFALKIRVPGWARNEVVPSDLYRFADPNHEPIVMRVNGQQVAPAQTSGYSELRREWRRGDIVELVLPMPVRRVVASDRVEADRGRVALQRGPIVFAAEWPDNANSKVRNIVLPHDAQLTSEFRPDLLNGVQVIKGHAFGLAYDAQGKVVKTGQELVAIPYATWANRGRGPMIVWLAASDDVARPTPRPTPATTSTVTTSEAQRNPTAINDGEDPQASDDPASYFDWPRRGTTEWVEYAFARPAAVSDVEVYWFEDTGHGEVRVPASWRVLYKDGDTWKPVDAREPYGVEKDRYNKVTFTPVTTSGLRLEVTMQPEWSAGIQEWKVR
jgi:hypothetical protein